MDDARDLDATGLEIDNEKHEIANQSTGGEHFLGEEIRCSYGSPVGFQEGAPGSAFVPRGRSAISLRLSRHNAFAFAARRRRWSSVKLRRRAPSCSRSTRFSSFSEVDPILWTKMGGS